MVFATSFAVLLSLNPYKHEPPVCPTDVAIDVDVDADGDQLRLFGVVLGVNSTKTTDPEPLELRAPAPIEPTDVRHATTELSGQVSSVGGTPQWAVISFDTFDMEGIFRRSRRDGIRRGRAWSRVHPRISG